MHRSTPGSKNRWLVGTLLLVPIVMPLIPALYTWPGPALLGFPFYYWFQLMLIVVGAVFTGIAYLLVPAAPRHGHEDAASKQTVSEEANGGE